MKMDLLTLDRVIKDYPKLSQRFRILIESTMISICFRRRDYECEDHPEEPDQNYLYYDISEYSEEELRELIEHYYIYYTFGESKHNIVTYYPK